MTTILRLHVAGKDEPITISVCDDCPFFRDPDPHPCFCVLDKDCAAGAVIPDDCPLPRLQIEVVQRAPEYDR